MAQPRALQSSPGLSDITCRVTMDSSTCGWGAVCEGMPTSGLWSEPQSRWHINRLELEAVFLALKDFQPQLEQRHVLIRTNNMSVVSYINHQGGIRSKPLYEQAADLLLWADSFFLSIRAAHKPGLLNRGADMLSRRGITQGEWRLHPESVWMIWTRFGRAEVDLFATSENAHCPQFFSLSHSPLEGDALTSRWPAAKLYAFPPIQILPLVLCKIKEERASVILIAPNLPNQPWFPDLTELLVAPHRLIPVRMNLLSQVWHPSPELWGLMCGCFRVIRGDERLTVLRARHAHGRTSTLYKTFVCLKMGSVCEMIRSGSY